MPRYGLFGRPCRGAWVHLFKVLHYLQKQGGHTPGSQGPESDLGCNLEVLTRQLFRAF